MNLPGAFPAVASSLTLIRDEVHSHALAAGATPKVILAAVLAVNEAATNAIVHGYEGGAEHSVVDVGCESGNGWLRYSVGDTGTGLRPRRNSPGVGLGFAIIAQLADELELREIPSGGIVVAMGFRLAG